MMRTMKKTKMMRTNLKMMKTRGSMVRDMRKRQIVSEMGLVMNLSLMSLTSLKNWKSLKNLKMRRSDS